LRVRSNAEGGGELLALVHGAVDKGLPYDVMSRQLIAASGKAGLTPEVGFILGDAADPMALASTTAQVFLGVRIGCAQCHNHPFDTWTRKQFYDMAAFFGKTRRVESRFNKRRLGVYLTEEAQTTILWPPENKTEGKVLARLDELRERQAKIALSEKTRPPSVEDLLGEAASKIDKQPGKDPLDVATEAKIAARDLNVDKDVYKVSEQRNELARLVTDP